ncbi:MAG: DUF4125 family protein [Coriobacteriales bacterium]|nr:DUF4125 family protein [Coriobacteriales bacterium]
MNAASISYAKSETIDAIVAREWEMFVAVNEKNGNRAACQEDPESFTVMRRSQFAIWSEAAAASYLNDLIVAGEQGRNLLQEKYVLMMLIDAPQLTETYLPLVHLPEEGAFALADAILALMMRQTRILRQRYPYFGRRGRPLTAGDASRSEVSIQSYQLGELLTYSEATLKLLLEQIELLESQGISIVEEILLGEMRSCGFASLEDAEKTARQQNAEAVVATAAAPEATAATAAAAGTSTPAVAAPTPVSVSATGASHA